MIVESPPFSRDWKGLDGTWTKRFLLAATELKPELEHANQIKLDLERANSSLNSFWTSIMSDKEAKLRSAGESTASTPDAPDSTVPGLRRAYEHESSPSPKNVKEFDVKDRELFTKRFEKMKPSCKWRLNSGRYVEDVVHELGKECKYHNLVHSFIINPEDDYIRSHFTDEELNEIVYERVRNPPALDSDLLKFISSFAKLSTAEIRKELNRPHPKLGEGYNPKTDFPYNHVKSTVADWILLLEADPNPLTLDLPEAWYRTNVWRCIDIAFSNIPYVVVVGGERAGIASTERKNLFRTLANELPTQRKVVGKKGDGYVRSVGQRLVDWASSEAGPYWEGIKGTKLLQECGLVLPRQLKDIFMSLAREVKFDEEKIRAIDVPGFIHAGAMLITTKLDCPKGYICRYTIHPPYEVYADVQRFDQSLDALVAILYAKNVIVRTMNVVNSAGGGVEEKALARWKTLGVESKRKIELADIPDCHPTPKKKKQAKMGKNFDVTK
ncbi:hypothetical protein BC936DRAFT_139824 [Jimgerdemannia flammicorona]|uniref:Uncharacterized protein n=1 Tax=Jimgerdemannia flammicorona TaxID=994334 RepID=A0A433DHH0_9FUNG|nr:hypothetical protein BC936DRAFT_139824 [Jimgerdemannia flammicorona]